MNKRYVLGCFSAVFLSGLVLVGGAPVSSSIRSSKPTERLSEPIELNFPKKNIEFKNKTDFLIKFQLLGSKYQDYPLYSLKSGEVKVIPVGPKLSRISMSGNHKYSIKSDEVLKLQLKDAPENSLFEITFEGNALKVTKK